MTPLLAELLCDPISGQALNLIATRREDDGTITEGTLVTASGDKRYPVVRGIPRFLPHDQLQRSVTSFGDQWNHFNFTDFKVHWLSHTVANTFGSTSVFRDKVIVDAGGGSGAQTLWMLESGARHVIMLELSHSVDDVVQRNLAPSGFRNVDVVQCSIDAPPLRPRSIDGFVICHNVIQHTPSVERTAHALFELVGSGSEFVFNCYRRNDDTPLRWVRMHLVYKPLRAVLSRMPFGVNMAYAVTTAAARQVPGVGTFLEKAGVCVQGDVPIVEGEDRLARLRRRFRASMLNTFDGFGSHTYQHHKTDAELRALLADLQPDAKKILNADRYFSRPPPIGCALRVVR
jgi:uncharacterized protein YbaR (Trm112 family)